MRHSSKRQKRHSKRYSNKKSKKYSKSKKICKKCGGFSISLSDKERGAISSIKSPFKKFASSVSTSAKNTIDTAKAAKNAISQKLEEHKMEAAAEAKLKAREIEEKRKADEKKKLDEKHEQEKIKNERQSKLDQIKNEQSREKHISDCKKIEDQCTKCKQFDKQRPPLPPIRGQIMKTAEYGGSRRKSKSRKRSSRKRSSRKRSKRTKKH